MAVSINSRAMKPKGVLRADLEVADYAELRLYAGAATTLFVTGSGIAGTFVRDATVTVDNGGTEIVGVHGWRRVFDGALLVEWFGAVADWNGATGTDNYTAFSSAISAATASRRPLQASGRYYVEFGAGRDRLSVAGDLVVCGTSKYASEVKFGPADVAKAIRGFDVASGADFTIRDIKLTSPALSVFPLFDSLQDWAPVWFSPSSSTLIVERCYFGDQWNEFVVSGPGGTRPKFILKDSHFQGFSVGFSLACAGAIQGRIEASGCTFQGHSGEAPDWAGRGHAMYPHPHVSLVLEKCRFLGGGRALINHFSSGAIAYTATPPEIISISDCYFGPCIAAALLTSHLNTRTILNNCVFDDCSGVSARCDTVLNSCSAVNGGSLGGPYNSDGTNGYMTRMEFNNCQGEAKTSATSGVATPLILTKDVDAASTGTLAVIHVNGGRFKSNGASIIDANGPKNTYIQGATFEFVAGTGLAVMSRLANARIVNCRFSGAWVSGSCLRNIGTGTLEIIDNEFDINVATGTVVEYNAPAGSVTGENNRYRSSATLRSGNAQNVRLRRGRNPSTVVSAATLVLDPNYDYHRISGAAAISRIRFGAQDDYAKPYSDAIRLIVDTGGTWSLSSAVNIVPISTAARAADEVIELYYDPSVDKWYEV